MPPLSPSSSSSSDEEDPGTPPPLSNFYLDASSDDESDNDREVTTNQADEKTRGPGEDKNDDEDDVSDASTVLPPHEPAEDISDIAATEVEEEECWDSNASTVEPETEDTIADIGAEDEMEAENMKKKQGGALELNKHVKAEQERERELTEQERRRALDAITVVNLDGDGEILYDTDEVDENMLEVGTPRTPEELREPPFIGEQDAVFLDDGADAVVVNSREVLPRRVARFLSVYQREGVEFFFRLYIQGSGGLLGDDMGLGKTVQAACFIGAVCGAYHAGTDRLCQGTVLLVSPAAVIAMWLKELKKWTGLRVEEYKGDEWEMVQHHIDAGKTDVLVSSLDGVRRDNGGMFTRRVWDLVVIDEIHNARNVRSKTWKVLSEDMNVKALFGLSGTVFQNSLKELWAVVALVVRGRAGWPSRDAFKEKYVKIIDAGSSKDAQDAMRKLAKKKIVDLQRLLRRHMMRRDKSFIESKLFGKDDQFVFVKIRPYGLQGRMYRKLLNSYDAKLLRDAKKPCDCGSGIPSRDCCHRCPQTAEELAHAPLWKLQHPDGQSCERCPYCIIFRFMHTSISISNHALLLKPDENTVDTPESRGERNALCEYYFDGLRRVDGPDFRDLADGGSSCKLIAVLTLAKKFQAQGHKTLIFFESLRMGKVLEQWALKNSFRYKQITGATSRSLRQSAVEDFNDDKTCPLFFISKRAGGTGLNIASANRVIIFEPCWNPTHDLQAQDRAYRLGQKRHVRTFRLIAKDSVEDYIFRTSTKKSQLAASVLNNVPQEARFNSNEVKNLAAMLSKTGIFHDPEKDPPLEFEDINYILSDLNTLPPCHEPSQSIRANQNASNEANEFRISQGPILGDPDADVSDLIPFEACDSGRASNAEKAKKNISVSQNSDSDSFSSSSFSPRGPKRWVTSSGDHSELEDKSDEDIEPENSTLGETQDIEQDLIDIGAGAAVYNTTTRDKNATGVLVNMPIRKNGIPDNITSTLESGESADEDGLLPIPKNTLKRVSRYDANENRRKRQRRRNPIDIDSESDDEAHAMDNEEHGKASLSGVQHDSVNCPQADEVEHIMSKSRRAQRQKASSKEHVKNSGKAKEPPKPRNAFAARAMRRK